MTAPASFVGSSMTMVVPKGVVVRIGGVVVVVVMVCLVVTHSRPCSLITPHSSSLKNHEACK